MKKTDGKTIQLEKGAICLYDFGSVRLYAYETRDFLSDEVFIVEKNGKAIVIEQPCFFDNVKELTDYLAETGVEVAGKLLAYHAAGATFLPNAPVYATRNAADYSASGGGKALITNFTGAFGETFDTSISPVTNVLAGGKITIAGIELNIVPTDEAFDIEIPEINAVYIHMLGHDCHSIVAGAGHADALIAELREFEERGFDLILTSHYTPEDLKDAATKADYLIDLKAIAASSADADAFKAKVAEKYPNYSGGNYLDMTAGFFFPA